MMENTSAAGSMDLAPNWIRLWRLSSASTAPIAAPAIATMGRDFEPTSSSWRSSSRPSNGRLVVERSTCQMNMPSSPNHSRRLLMRIPDCGCGGANCDGWLREIVGAVAARDVGVGVHYFGSGVRGLARARVTAIDGGTAWSRVMCMSNFSWRTAWGARVKMAVGTSQGGVETGKDMNNIAGGRRLCETGQYGIVSKTRPALPPIKFSGKKPRRGVRRSISTMRPLSIGEDEVLACRWPSWKEVSTAIAPVASWSFGSTTDSRSRSVPAARRQSLAQVIVGRAGRRLSCLAVSTQWESSY